MSRLEAALRRAQTLNYEADRASLPVENVQVHDRPEPAHDRPEPAHDRPMPVYDRPMPVYDRPVQIHDRPVQIHDRPVQIHDRPGPAHDRDAEMRKARALASLTYEVSAPEPASAMDFTGASADKLVVTSRPEQSTVEQYRKLAGTLHHAQVERNLKVVMVSSAVSGDGKTLTSTNLALTLSESYRRRVLLIDADLRRPSVHEVFQLKNTAGLTDCLKAPTDRQLPIIQASPYLSLLLAGRPDSDPMSGLTSDRMQRLISEAAATFDWVVIDTPPVVLLPDANLLAAMVDGAILVIGAGKTPHKLITRAIDALGRTKILGVVLNRVDRSILAGGYGYGYYSYGER